MTRIPHPEYLNYLIRHELPYRAGRARDAAIRFVVWRLMPRRMVMWAGFRIISHATTGRWSNQEVPRLTAMEAMDRWDRDNSRAAPTPSPSPQP